MVDRIVMASATETDNSLSFAVVTLEGAGGAPPVHRHLRHAESFFILDGTFRFLVGDQESMVGPGGFVFVPPSTAHGFVSADGRGGRMIELFTPGDFEGYFDEVARLLAIGASSGDYAAAQSRFGMEVVGPPLDQGDPGPGNPST